LFVSAKVDDECKQAQYNFLMSYLSNIMYNIDVDVLHKNRGILWGVMHNTIKEGWY